MNDMRQDMQYFASDDSKPIEGVSVHDVLDEALIMAHIQQAAERGRYAGPTDVVDYLLDRKCAVLVGSGLDREAAVYPTPAAILCFGKTPQAMFPRAVVDLGHYRGIEGVSHEVVHLEKNIGGTIIDQLHRVETYLWTNTHHGMTIADNSFQRVEVHQYPQVIIRELCVNLVAHRDYTNFHSAARVMLFRDRIEWANPGGLPPGMSVDNILNEQYARNPTILTLLYDAGYVEAFGQGLNTVVSVSRQAGLPPPSFLDTGASFIATAFGRSVESLNSSDLGVKLNENQRKVLKYLRSRPDATPLDLRELLEDTTEGRLMQRTIKPLLEARLVVSRGQGRAIRYYIPEEA